MRSALIIGGGIIAYLTFRALGHADPVALAQTAANPDVSIDTLTNGGPITRLIELNSNTTLIRHFLPVQVSVL